MGADRRRPVSDLHGGFRPRATRVSVQRVGHLQSHTRWAAICRRRECRHSPRVPAPRAREGYSWGSRPRVLASWLLQGHAHVVGRAHIGTCAVREPRFRRWGQASVCSAVLAMGSMPLIPSERRRRQRVPLVLSLRAKLVDPGLDRSQQRTGREAPKNTVALTVLVARTEPRSDTKRAANGAAELVVGADGLLCGRVTARCLVGFAQGSGRFERTDLGELQGPQLNVGR